jgi:putative MATE family efflux protein
VWLIYFGKEAFFSNRALFNLFLPIIIEQFLEYLVGLADSIMAASVGEAAVSGVSLVDFVMALLISLFAALSTGGAVVAGQYLGRKQQEKARNTANQLVWFAGLSAVLIMVLVYVLKPFILHGVFGAITPEVYGYADRYLMITAASIPFLALYNAGAAIFRTMGNARLPMMIMLAMNIAHAAGNAVLIYGFHFGVEGVAIPTLIARVAAAIIVLFLVMDKKQALYLECNWKPQFDAKIIHQILGIGIPYGLENGLFYLGRIVVLSLVSLFGTSAIAANAVGGTLVMFEALPGMAIGFGLTVVAARCIGAKDYEQAKYYTRKVLKIVYVAQIIMCTLVLLLLPSILSIYGLSAEAADLTYKLVWAHAIVEIIIWPLAYTLPVTFRAAGDARFPMVIGTASMIFCRILLSYVFALHFGMGMFGTWVAMFFDWAVKALIFCIRYIKGSWTKYQAID